MSVERQEVQWTINQCENAHLERLHLDKVEWISFKIKFCKFVIDHIINFINLRQKHNGVAFVCLVEELYILCFQLRLKYQILHLVLHRNIYRHRDAAKYRQKINY